MHRTKVAVYGGTFNPVHNGHMHLARHILWHNLADKVLFMPTAFPPVKRDVAPYEDRVAMLRGAIQGEQHMEVSTLEAELPAPNYTLQTLDALSSKMVDSDFSWVIGADELMTLHTWKPDPIRLVRTYDFLIFFRPGIIVDLAKLNEYWPGWLCQKLLSGVVFSVATPDTSSSDIRKDLQSGKIPMDALPMEVREYIIKHPLLYRRNS